MSWINDLLYDAADERDRERIAGRDDRPEDEVARLAAENERLRKDLDDGVTHMEIRAIAAEVEVARLRERAERTERALREVVRPLSIGIGYNLYCSEWPGYQEKLFAAKALVSSLDVAPTGEGRDG
jgi:hypothetical protein